MAKSPDFTKEVLRQAGIKLVVEGLKWGLLWSLPFVLAGLAVVAGYAQSVPWLYTIAVATFVFAAAATGALRISEWRWRITSRNKLIFQQVVPAADFIKDKRTGKTRWIDKIQLCLVFQNSAHFPISYIVDDLSTSFESLVNPKPDRKIKGAIIQAGTSGWYRDSRIELRKMPIDKMIFEGTAKFKIRYGFPGNEKHIIERNLTVTLVFDDKSGGFNQITIGDVIED